MIAFTCRRHGLRDDDAEEFAGSVRLRLVENDYAILRKFEGRSSLATFLTVVVQRMLLDRRIQAWGKWHASAEATRLGPVAVELEKLVYRDGRMLDEVLPILRRHDTTLTRESLERLLEKLPRRAPRRRFVALEEAGELAATSSDAEARAVEREHAERSLRLSGIVTEFLAGLPPDEKLALQLRFDSGMTVAEISRSLHCDQRALYRSMEKRLRELRERLERGGIAADDARELIGSRGVVLDFRLKTDPSRPSNSRKETLPSGREEISP
ncbi:MAG TPA: sigma-70 family RNA polymerase sigma factor [Thermoanaerobaculia bacterium]|nr:sigma-70 family RNA polymerase sigma factor [Thermoanaerobaculia bacterium]